MNLYNVLLKPVLSEKSNKARETANQYTFEIALSASKADVAKAVQTLYGVKATSVTTLVQRGKVKRKGNHLVMPKRVKKAVVSLPEGSKIPLFEDQ